jgi:hypothetical protein
LFDLFQGPYREKKRYKLQKVVGDDNVLIVNFSDIPGHTNTGHNIGTYCSFYHQFVKDGIILGLRRYRFLSKFLWLQPLEILISLSFHVLECSISGIYINAKLNKGFEI